MTLPVVTLHEFVMQQQGGYEGEGPVPLGMDFALVAPVQLLKQFPRSFGTSPEAAPTRVDGFFLIPLRQY